MDEIYIIIGEYEEKEKNGSVYKQVVVKGAYSDYKKAIKALQFIATKYKNFNPQINRQTELLCEMFGGVYDHIYIVAKKINFTCVF